MDEGINCKIKITEAAREYLEKKGKREVSIEYPNYRTNSDCVFIPVPEIFARRPKSEGYYHKVTVGGIDVFLSKSVILPEDNDIVINVQSFLKIKSLTVSGFNLKEWI